MNKAKKMVLYIYCVTDKEPCLKEIRTLNPDAYSVNIGGLYTVVCKVPKDEFYGNKLKENLNCKKWMIDKITCHEKIIETVMKKSTVVPFRFAVLFNSVENIKQMLKDNANVFKKNLAHLKGKEEWSIKVYCEGERLKNLIVVNNRDILRISGQIDASSPGKAFLLKKKKEDMINTTLKEKLYECVQSIFSSLRENSNQSKIIKLSLSEIAKNKRELLLNSVFLIGRNRKAGFDDIIKDMKKEHTEKGFLIDCSGPWPPYNFCRQVDLT